MDPCERGNEADGFLLTCGMFSINANLISQAKHMDWAQSFRSINNNGMEFKGKPLIAYHKGKVGIDTDDLHWAKSLILD